MSARPRAMTAGVFVLAMAVGANAMTSDLRDVPPGMAALSTGEAVDPGLTDRVEVDPVASLESSHAGSRGIRRNLAVLDTPVQDGRPVAPRIRHKHQWRGKRVDRVAAGVSEIATDSGASDWIPRRGRSRVDTAATFETALR